VALEPRDGEHWVRVTKRVERLGQR
jgi:hypothetical protein